MSGATGTADFFYREALRLGYVARSAFKVSTASLPPPLSLPALRLGQITNLSRDPLLFPAAAADPDTEAAQAHRPGRRRARPRVRPRGVAPGGLPEPGPAREGRPGRRRRCQGPPIC